MAKLFFARGQQQAKKLAYRYQKGELNRIRRGIYVDVENEDEVAKTLESKWYEIARYIFVEPIAIARTAVELKPAGGRLYLVSSRVTARRTVDVGHLRFDIEPGNDKLGVEQFTLEMKRSNQARYMLENLKFSRGNDEYRKTLGSKWVEGELVRTIGRRGEDALYAIRDEARSLAPHLDLKKQFEKLNNMISAMLNTHPLEGVLQTGTGRAQARGEPFDQDRLQKFEALADYLIPITLSENPYTFNKSGWRNLSFFESYFSNYIEGTAFTIDEAEEIIFKGVTIYQRHHDSHDVMAHMEISADMAEMNKVPSSAADLLDILKARHRILMSARINKRPGEFKNKANKTGGTVFVLPEYVEGTLVQGFEIYMQLTPGIKRAIFIHFLISECHPFDDGNGRVARIMMNAELVSENQFKIIVPTVCRDNYLNSLRTSSRQGRYRVSLKVLHQLQCYTASLDWNAYGEVRELLEHHAADQEPEVGVAIFNKAISRMGDEYPAG